VTDRLRVLTMCLAAATLLGCHDRDVTPAEAPAGAEWLLEGSQGERFARVARHLRGFDMAMVEVGYRYSELYWAGRDRNWGYADYQLEKIVTALANGTERRPARAQSTRMLDGPIRSVRQAIEARSGEKMDAAFEQLTATCNTCHQVERVPFIHVAPPVVRVIPGGPRAPAAPDPQPE